MPLTVTLRDKQGDDFVRTLNLTNSKSGALVEHAAAAWVRHRLRAVSLFGQTVKRELTMTIEWVADSPSEQAAAERKMTIKRLAKKRSK